MSASPPSKPNNILCIPSEFLDDIAPAVPGSSFNLCFNVFIAVTINGAAELNSFI